MSRVSDLVDIMWLCRLGEYYAIPGLLPKAFLLLIAGDAACSRCHQPSQILGSYYVVTLCVVSLHLLHEPN